MPLHLPDRRQFLAVAGATLVVGAARAAHDISIDDSLIYLLNDTHIGEKHPTDSPVPTHLRQAVDHILALERPPAAVVINGDLALKDGQPGDYRHLARLLQPLRDAGVNLHLTLGNHDHRETFYEVLREERPESPAIISRHVSLVETRFANLLLLDSLQETMVTPGLLGDTQRDWLARALDDHPDKPAVIITHHNPRLGGDPLHFPGGLVDSEELWTVFANRKQVKAVAHGHIHDRGLAAHQGVHIINTPATSYVANPETSTTGWTTARLDAHGATLTTHTTDPAHAWNRQTNRLAWRV